MPVASINPDNFVAGGLKDDFIGTIKKARFCPWDYNGKLEKGHILAFRCEIALDAEYIDDPKDPNYIQHWSAGDLDSFVPSMDGETGVDLAAKSDDPNFWDGVYALQIGKKEGLSNSSNFGFFMRKAIEAKLPSERLVPNVAQAFEGLRCRFNRVPQPKRSGIVKAVKEGDQKRSDDILVITEILGVGQVSAGSPTPSPAKSASAPSAATPSTPASPPSTGNADLDAALVGIIKEAIRGQGAVLKGKIAQPVMKSLAPAQKGPGVKRISEKAFLESLTEHGILFDAAAGTLQLFE